MVRTLNRSVTLGIGTLALASPSLAQHAPTDAPAHAGAWAWERDEGFDGYAQRDYAGEWDALVRERLEEEVPDPAHPDDRGPEWTRVGAWMRGAMFGAEVALTPIIRERIGDDGFTLGSLFPEADGSTPPEVFEILESPRAEVVRWLLLGNRAILRRPTPVVPTRGHGLPLADRETVLAPMKQVADAMRVRMLHAGAEQDPTGVLDALDGYAACARAGSWEPSALGLLLVWSLETNACRDARRVAVDPIVGFEPDGATFLEMASRLDTPSAARVGYAMRGERLALTQGASLLRGTEVGPMAPADETCELVDRFGLAAERGLAGTGAERDAARAHVAGILNGLDDEFCARHVAACVGLPLVERLFAIDRERTLMREGVPALLNIEAFRAEHARPPATLAEALGDRIPVDPYSTDRAPLGYRVLTGEDDWTGRGYVLYSVGADHEDNAGTPPRTIHDQPLDRRSHGLDYVFNWVGAYAPPEPEPTPADAGTPEPDMNTPPPPA